MNCNNQCVTLIGRSNKIMTLQPANEIIKVQSIDDINTQFDVIIIAVKTHQLNPLIPKLHHFAHNETCFILAQNGLLPQLPFNRKYQAVVYIVVKVWKRSGTFPRLPFTFAKDTTTNKHYSIQPKLKLF